MFTSEEKIDKCFLNLCGLESENLMVQHSNHKTYTNVTTVNRVYLQKSFKRFYPGIVKALLHGAISMQLDLKHVMLTRKLAGRKISGRFIVNCLFLYLTWWNPALRAKLHERLHRVTDIGNFLICRFAIYSQHVPGVTWILNVSITKSIISRVRSNKAIILKTRSGFIGTLVAYETTSQ